MKKSIIISALIACACFGFTYPIVAELVGVGGFAVRLDSAFVTVVCEGETLVPWTSMTTIGRSAAYLECEIPDTILFAIAVVTSFWEDDLRDTTALVISSCGNPFSSATVIDSVLSESHGSGSWCSSLALPFLLTMSEEEFIASFGKTANSPISVFRGDSKRIDFLVLDADRDTVDLSDAIAVFTARIGESETNSVIFDTLEIPDSTNGVMRLELSPKQTSINPRSHAADVQLTFPDGRIFTVWKSRFIVKWDVSR